MSPKRIQRRRAAGWRKPESAVIVDRTSRWGNPFTVDDAIEAGYENPRRACVSHYTAWLEGHFLYNDVYEVKGRRFDRRWMLEHLADLKGRDLCCPCPLAQPCHSDVLLELANYPEAP